jgi:hypothetical protein
MRELVAFHIRGALTVWLEANLIRFHSFARCLRLRPKDLETCAKHLRWCSEIQGEETQDAAWQGDRHDDRS